MTMALSPTSSEIPCGACFSCGSANRERSSDGGPRPPSHLQANAERVERRKKMMRAKASMVSLLAMLAISSAHAADDITFTSKRVSLAALPPAVLNRPTGAPSETWCASQPALILDGSTLVIGRPGAAPDVTMRLRRLEL